jgi:hypothetical protein
MLSRTAPNRFGFYFSNQSTPSVTPGTSVTPGASNAEGSWTEVASAANISKDIYLLVVTVSGGASTGASKMQLLDIGWDAAGGTSYTAQISNIVCGTTSGGITAALNGVTFVLPIFIPSGAAVAVRVQGSNATAGTVRVWAEFYGQPSRPESIRAGQYAETIGTITNSNGVSFTPGNTNAEGSWQSLGTTTRPLWWFQLGVQPDDTSTGNVVYYFDLAYGDGSNKVMIAENIYANLSNGEAMSIAPQWNGFCEVPAGGELFVRGMCSATSDAGWNAVAVGVGG